MSGFELSGLVGVFILQGFGILLLMWNVPYVFAFINPIKFMTSYFEAVIMQSIGLVGESLLVFSIPATLVSLHSSVNRFILFDGIGFILILTGFLILRKIQ